MPCVERSLIRAGRHGSGDTLPDLSVCVCVCTVNDFDCETALLQGSILPVCVGGEHL